MKVRIKENSWIAKIAAGKMNVDQVAIVFNSTIYLHNTCRKEFLDDTDWVSHELKHVEQFRENGFVGFLVKYIFEWMKNGYHNNRFEVEARESEKCIELLQKVQFI